MLGKEKVSSDFDIMFIFESLAVCTNRVKLKKKKGLFYFSNNFDKETDFQFKF